MVRRKLPYGLVVMIQRFHRRGPGSIPGVGSAFTVFLNMQLIWQLNVFLCDHGYKQAPTWSSG